MGATCHENQGSWSIVHQGRRYIIQTLERLAWRKDTFVEAAQLLLRLAEAENQTWGNNATGIWTGLFLTYTGATEVPALERYSLLQEALQSGISAVRALVVEALFKALSVSETGNSTSEAQDGYVPLKRWHPTTWEEECIARRKALCLLDVALSDTDEQIQNRARAVLFDIARGMVTRGLAEEIMTRF
ncbi:MAG TPA: hypothetical protein VHZ51_22180 [Ktedonobacteraceae bacterium]|jgi:hypothetical protein|nr:hypothetical protein [Ktedonobacteraceae bacterium]